MEVVLASEGSAEKIARKYNILNHSVLRGWIIWHNTNMESKYHDLKGESYMVDARRKTATRYAGESEKALLMRRK